MYNPFKYSDLKGSMIKQSSRSSNARMSAGAPATASSSFFTSMFQSSKQNHNASDANNMSALDPEQVLHMSPQALKQKLCSPRQDRNRFSIWTCGTSKPQPNTNLNTSSAECDQSFSLSKKNLSIKMNNNEEYHSNFPAYNYSLNQFGRFNQDHASPIGRSYQPTKRKSGKYHQTRADQWEASKNLRHLMNKNVNFLHVGNEYGERSQSPYLKSYSKKAGGDNSYFGSMNTTANNNIASVLGRGSQNQYIDFSIKTPKDESILGKTTGSRSQKNFDYKPYLRERAESSNLM